MNVYSCNSIISFHFQYFYATYAYIKISKVDLYLQEFPKDYEDYSINES